MELTDTPDVEADTDAGREWGMYAISAGLAGAAFSIGNQTVGAMAQGLWNRAWGAVVGALDDATTQENSNSGWGDF